MRDFKRTAGAGQGRRSRTGRGGPAFTLVELMVVVAIIAVLIGLLIPAISAVRNQAKVVDTKALFASLTQGNEQFRSQQEIGGAYIPSATDSAACPAFGSYGVMANPFKLVDGGGDILWANGANLLVYGLAGADGLGTPGFPDLDGDGAWSNDLSDDPNTPTPGAYALDAVTRDPLHKRYTPFVSSDAWSRVRSITQLMEDGVILNGGGATDLTNELHASQRVFTDGWGRPVLYYRARQAAKFMITDPHPGSDEIGVYDQQDNAVYTGSIGGTAGFTGIDMGAGYEGHRIKESKHPQPNPQNSNLATGEFDNTFERFIWDQNVPQKNVPVNRETFLLISAGADALYGTTDDVINWASD